MGKKILNKIKIQRLEIIKITAGNIMRILKKKNLTKGGFGEAYFSKIKFRSIKAWKYHKKMFLNLTVPVGKVKFVFYSEKDNRFRVIEIGEKKYSRITVPPKIWFGFKGIGKSESIILNITNIEHNPKEIIRRKKNQIKFKW